MPEPPKKDRGESKHGNKDNEDAELILVRVKHVNEDAKILFIGVISNSKPVILDILKSNPGMIFQEKERLLESRSRLFIAACKPCNPCGTHSGHLNLNGELIVL